MSAPPPKPPDKQPNDSRTESFLRRAGSVIATERGLNAKSRVKLESIARDMRLPDDVFDQCMQMLQGNPPAVKRKPTRWERAFEKLMHSQLRKIETDILTADMERKAIEFALKKYQLTEAQAQDVIQKATEELGIRRISVSDAERHVEGIINEKIGDSAWIDDATRQRFHAVGREWGVPITHVESLIEIYTRQNLQQQKRDQRAGNLFIATGVMIVMVVLGGFVVLTVSNHRHGTESEPDRLGQTDKKSVVVDGGSSVSKVVPPEWWDQSLSLAIVKTRIKVDAFDGVYPLIAAESPETRKAGYRQLVDLAFQLHDDREASAQLRTVLAGIVAQEPKDECVDELVEPLVAKLLPNTERLPDQPADYDLSLWAVETLVEMLPENRDEPDNARLRERRERIQADLASATNGSIVNAYGRRELSQRHLRALSERLYRHLISNAGLDPDKSMKLRDRLAKLTDRYFTDEQLVQFDTQFATSLLMKHPERWPDMRKLVSSCIASGTPTEWIQMLGVLESTDNEGLQLFIAGELADVLETSLPSNNLEEISSTLRRSLGASAQSLPVTGTQRWAILRRKLKSVDQDLEFAKKDALMVAPAITGLTHVGTLACALSQGESGYAVFDRWVEEESFETEDRSESGTGFLRGMFGTGDTKRPSRQVLDAFDRKVKRLEIWSELNPRSRTDLLNRIASDDVPRIDDIKREQGQVIASYLLGMKSDDELAENLNALKSVREWNQLIIAVADAFRYGEVSRDRAQKIASIIAGVDLLLDGGEQQWRQNLGNRLLGIASDRLLNGAPNARERDFQGFGELQLSYRIEYDRRADLIAGASTGTTTSDSASNAVEKCLLVLAEKLAGSSRGTSSAALESLDQKIDVAYYLGGNNMAQTVALQRLFIQLVAARTIEDLPQYASKVDNRVAELNRFDQEATDVVEQLREGESTLLELWMMYNL